MFFYGLKSAGAAFQAHLVSFMHQMGYTSCKADPDLWLKAMIRPKDNVHYYAYILCYVDDILCTHHDLMAVMGEGPLTGHQRAYTYSHRHSLLVTRTNRLLPFSARWGVEWNWTGILG